MNLHKTIRNFACIAALLSNGIMMADASSTETQPKYIQYHNRMAVFSPLHQAYERIKNDAFYVGVEAWVLSNLAKEDKGVLDAELRMGYNFFYRGKDHLTPFAGVGFFKDFSKTTISHVHHRIAPIGYGTLGFKYAHEFNSIFNLGLDLKGILGGSFNTDDTVKWGSPVYGFDIALPITFRFGRNRHWDYRIEPFYTFLYSAKQNVGVNWGNYVGFRNTLAYRF